MKTLFITILFSCISLIVSGQSKNLKPFHPDQKITDSSLITPKAEIVVVDIVVDLYGNVLEAKAGGRGTTTRDTLLYRRAREAALKTKFDTVSDLSEQKGHITFLFNK